MAGELPETVRVKLSSEEAGAVSVTPVVARDMPLGELVVLMLDLTGKDIRRVQDLLLRGTLVSGATRYRWQGWQASAESVEALLARFPDAEPGRPFSADHCAHLVLHGPGLRIDLERPSLMKKSPLSRRCFWDVLMEVVNDSGLDYAGYSYRERADRYRLEVSHAVLDRLVRDAALLRFSALEAKFRNGAVRTVEFFVVR